MSRFKVISVKFSKNGRQGAFGAPKGVKIAVAAFLFEIEGRL